MSYKRIKTENDNKSSEDSTNNKFKDFVDIFNKNLIINMGDDCASDDNKMNKDLINEMDKLNITKDYIYIYIYSYNICNPKKYEENKIYINNTGILTNKNNRINYTNNLIINKKYIKCIYKIKVNNIYYKLVYLKNKYNFKDLDIKWKDYMFFFNLYNYKNNNFIDCIINNNNIKNKLIIINNDKIHSKLNLKHIYNNMNKNFNKIFK